MDKIKCQICNGDVFHKVTSKGQFNIEVNVVICKKCGFTFLNPRWSKEEYLKFYTEEYEKYYPRTSYDVNQEKAVFKLLSDRLLKNNIIPNDFNILDIGSGFGGNLRNFNRDSSINKLYAIEPSNECINYLKKENINVISNDVDIDWEDKYVNFFDLVIMRHVLEHFSDPQRTLEKVRAVLNNDGKVYIAVPDIYHPKSPLNSYYFRAVHLSYFSIKSISQLLHKVGFEIIDMKDNLNGELYVVAKKSKKIINPKYSKLDYFKQRYILYKQYKKEKSK